MDIVIPYESSVNDDEELIFTLRSIEKNIPMATGKVWIVGDKPKWNGKYEHIPMPNPYKGVRWRDRNIANKMIAAAMRPEISYKFLLAHDDNFVMYHHAEYYPYFHTGSLWKGAGDYWNVEQNTRKEFGSINNYDVHCPHIMNKEGVLKLQKLDWTVEYGYCCKTAYAFYNKVESEFCTDLKIKGQYEYKKVCDLVTAGTRFFSCSDMAWRPGVRQFLLEHFPNKSRFEN